VSSAYRAFNQDWDESSHSRVGETRACVFDPVVHGLGRQFVVLAYQPCFKQSHLVVEVRFLRSVHRGSIRGHFVRRQMPIVGVRAAFG
jgi:hypothetical protein